MHLDTRQKTCHIIDSFSHQRDYVIVEFLHTESTELRVKDDTCIVFTTVGGDLGLSMRSHVFPPSHSKFFLG